ncbi:unnamed protein product [Rotaria sordida]|uniref:Uncharacterized protein n=2 Tax=Rotaria sordida TaxID=392033 RepID=A0A815BU33_9BILA|nr:unnamed protein product [Rotaria sordida]CAF1553551.1 unnamed protein product [Rotaria sordida]
MMNDFSRRVNSIVVKNLPTDFTPNQLEELFSPFGQILSSKVLPYNSNFEGGCGFVNYANAESCNEAVDHMNNYVIQGFTLRVSQSMSRSGNNNFNRSQNGFRTTSTTNINPDENTNTSSPSTQSRFSSVRPVIERPSSTTQSKSISINSAHSSTHELDTVSNVNKPLWNGNIEQQQQQQRTLNGKSPFQNDISIVNQQMNIEEHEEFIINKTYNIYLSNLEVPNIIFAATLDDYVNATLLITQMNKHEQLTKVQANSYKAKLTIGQICAALFNGDWYRARILEVGENRVRVQYIDWGNTGWCDSILEIRPLPNEYYKDPVLCVKCILDGVSSNEKLSDEQTNAILGILVLDLKLEMTVLRIENNIPYVRLNLGERNLNNEIRTILLSSNTKKQNQIMDFNSNKPDINLSEIHYVQLTTVDIEPECFHVLLMRDCLPIIMNVLKDWHANKQPLTTEPKPNMLVCAQYDADDLWYRGWIQNVTEDGYRVYFVDFGNEEIVSIDRLSECPDNLKNIPWQSIQIKLANIKLTDDERYILLRDFETDRLEMKIIQKHQDIYYVDLITNEKSLVEHILELRKKQQLQINEVPKIPMEPVQQIFTNVSTSIPVTTMENVSRTSNEYSQPIPLPVQPIVDIPGQPAILNNSKMLPSSTITNSTTTVDAAKMPLSSTLNTMTKQEPITQQKNDISINDNLITLINEQRRQNRLLEQIIAAINTTNALLTQLVQR